MRDVPSLNVVMNPSVDTAARRVGLPITPAVENEFNPTQSGKKKVRGLQPGPYEDSSWHMMKNVIPVKDYEHEKFRQTKGQDFNIYHRPRHSLYKRAIVPLSDGEYTTHLFTMEPNTGIFRDSYGRPFVLPDVNDVKLAKQPLGFYQISSQQQKENGAVFPMATKNQSKTGRQASMEMPAGVLGERVVGSKNVSKGIVGDTGSKNAVLIQAL